MYVFSLAVHFDQLRLEIGTNFFKHCKGVVSGNHRRYPRLAGEPVGIPSLQGLAVAQMLGWEAASSNFFVGAAGIRISCAFGLPASVKTELN